MENLFLITGILFFVTQTAYLAVAAWRDTTHVGLSTKMAENQQKILSSYEWTIEWTKGAERQFYAICQQIEALHTTAEGRKE
jgi:hypothetical protein